MNKYDRLVANLKSGPQADFDCLFHGLQHKIAQRRARRVAMTSLLTTVVIMFAGIASYQSFSQPQENWISSYVYDQPAVSGNSVTDFVLSE